MRQCIRHPACHAVPYPKTTGCGRSKRLRSCDPRRQAISEQYGHGGTGSIMVKLDIWNAFNSLHRNSMLSSVDEILPKLAAYCHVAYGEATSLQFGKFTVLSQEDSKQGDPLGPLLFCLPLQPILTRLLSPLASEYLDDITLGGDSEVVEADVDLIEGECLRLGLVLNRSKCELIASNFDFIDTIQGSLRLFTRVNPSSAVLLGAPLSPEKALFSALDTCVANLETALDRLQLIDRQDALLLLRCSLGSPKLMYLLRCAPCYDHLRLIDYDKLQRGGMERILNISLTEDQWMQASLPIRMGGLGVRRVSSLALPAFLASAAGTLSIQSLILGPTWNGEDASFDCAQADWLRITGIEDPATCPGHKQSLWNKPLLLKALSSFRERLHDPYDRARLNASMAPHASNWLHSLPLTTFNLKLSDEDVRVAVGLRLGSAICEPHTCGCGAPVSARGAPGLSCSLGFGRQARHSNMNDIILRSLNRAGTPAIREPSGLTRLDGKRPDGQTLVPWNDGRSLIWDATVVDTVAASYVEETAIEPGSAAEKAATRKHSKYAELERTYTVVPVAVETLGPINSEGLAFLTELGRRLSNASGDTREARFLFQSLSVTVQRYNAVAFQGTLSGLLVAECNP